MLPCILDWELGSVDKKFKIFSQQPGVEAVAGSQQWLGGRSSPLAWSHSVSSAWKREGIYKRRTENAAHQPSC